MSTVIAFPSKRETRARVAPSGRRTELSGPKVVILPVVRIERHMDAIHLDAIHAEPVSGSSAPVRLDRTRAPYGLGPSGRRH